MPVALALFLLLSAFVGCFVSTAVHFCRLFCFYCCPLLSVVLFLLLSTFVGCFVSTAVRFCRLFCFYCCLLLSVVLFLLLSAFVGQSAVLPSQLVGVQPSASTSHSQALLSLVSLRHRLCRASLIFPSHHSVCRASLVFCSSHGVCSAALIFSSHFHVGGDVEDEGDGCRGGDVGHI